MARHPLRVLWRFWLFLWMSATALLDFWWRVRPQERKLGRVDFRARSLWTHRHARRFSRMIAVEVETVGKLPTSGMLCCNHLSYLDIVVLVWTCPMVFVSKAEVKNWPIVGWLTSCAGTIFIQRERRGDVLNAARQFDPVVEQGVPVNIFLEGTSSGGESVLPFRPSLLAPAVAGQWQVTPIGLDYRLNDGSVSEEIAYWRDMTFFPHFLNLLSKEKIFARVSFGDPRPPGEDRKVLAPELHDSVVALRLAPATIPQTSSVAA
jgi:lyso-ornithine lipid O-acyltransferase